MIKFETLLSSKDDTCLRILSIFIGKIIRQFNRA